MVFGHILFDEFPRNASGKRHDKNAVRDLEARLASPLDRVAAFVADMILLVPLMTLITSPFRRQALEAQLIENSDGWGAAYASGAVVCFIAYLAYQTVFLAWWGATPGKRAIGLRVEPLWEARQKPRAMAAFVRAFATFLEVLCFGLPWVAVFGNPRRRPFHDRVGDTVVVATRAARAAGPPSVSEVAMSGGIIAATLFVFAFLISVQILHLGGNSDSDNLIADLEDSGGLCTTVGEAYRNWIPMNGEEKPSRIAVALTLFQAEAVNEKCLRDESEFSLWTGTDKATGYLARGFAESEDRDVAEEYFKKVCTTDSTSDACKAMTILDSPGKGEEPATEVSEAIEEKTAEVDHENDVDRIVAGLDAASAPYLRILVVREYEDRQQDERALDILATLSPQNAYAYFLSSHRAKALWNLDRKTEARLALRSSVEVANDADRVEIAKWFCDGETMAMGCTADAKDACDFMGTVVDQHSEYLISPENVATYLRGENCSDRLTAERLESLEKKVPEGDSRIYVQALVKLKDEDSTGAVELLRKLANEERTTGPFFIEASARLAELATSPDELKLVRNVWSLSDPSQAGWGFLGRRLMERFTALKDYDQAVTTGMKISENNLMDRLATRAMIVATHRAGKAWLTANFLAKLGELPKLESVPHARMPASNPDSYEEVIYEIVSKEASKGHHR